MPESPVYMRTSDLYKMLRARHDPQAWALLFEVADATGARQQRWADAVAMGLWPSRGLNLHGYEVKASRTDWLKELKTPAKAEAICQFCDYWWLVVADKCIVHDGELPATWGLLAPNKKGVLTTIKEAPKLSPVPIDRQFLAALLRAAAKPCVAMDRERLNEEYSRGHKDEEASSGRIAARATESLQSLQNKVNDFEAAAGFRIDSWNHKADAVGRIVRDVLMGVHDRDRDDLQRIRDLASAIVDRIDGTGLVTRGAA